MVTTIGPFKEYVISALEIENIETVMQEMFGAGVQVKSKFGRKFGKLLIGDDLIGSVMPRSSAKF